MIHYKLTKEDVLKHTFPCKCHKCENSCNYGSGAFTDDQIEKLAKFLKKSIDEVKNDHLEEIKKFNTTLLRPKIERSENKPYGKCTFYSKGDGCTIHEVKPIECKIAMGCLDYGEDLIKWFEFTHYFNPKDPESIRELKTYIESGGKIIQGFDPEEFIEKINKTDEFDDLKKKRHKDWDKILGLKDLVKEDKKNGKQ